MKKLFILLFCFLVSPVFAQNATPFCTAMTTRIHVKTRPGNPQYVTQYSREQFLQKAHSGQSPYTLGLTVARLDVTFKTKPQLSEQDGQICVALKEVEVEIKYPELVVYIDKKYMPSSCEYQVIREHENYHVAVAQQALSFFRPDIERIVSDTIAAQKPAIVYQRQEIQSEVTKFNRAISDALAPVIAHINKKLIEKNAAIDTKEMYAATTAVCKNW
ncbi:MAG: hypothetical protein II942_02615 [Alphaproteobacteria bacterium]|nr:hypothetical protein [Alphaproteobacteria bacterium]